VHFSSSWTLRQLKGNVILGLNKDTLDIKRTKANNNTHHKKINNSKSTNQNIKIRSHLSQDASKSLNHCKEIESFPSFQKLPIKL